MGAEIKHTVTTTKRLAPHRRYFPTTTRTETESPGPRGEWGLYPGEPETCRRRVLPFVRAMFQLGLMVALFKRYQIEGRAFLALATLALAAFPVHYLAPYHWKKPVFLGVSVVGLFWIFGSEVGSVVLGLATLLIGICFLPVSWNARAGGLALVAAALVCAQPIMALGSAFHRLASHCNDVHVPATYLYV